MVTPGAFKGEVRQWANRIGVEVGQIHLRTMKRKWASASTRSRLTFDVGLLRQPAGGRDEVIVHELVHLKVGNHGPLFRSLVRSYLADRVQHLHDPGHRGEAERTERDSG
jgi:predicted metal-dependent hydrolase